MELNAFIQSGLLESYLLGQCSSTENDLVERMLAQYPEVRVEMDRIEQALEGMAQAYAVSPPPDLKKRIFEEINRSPQAESVGDNTPAPSGSWWPMLSGILLLVAGGLFWQNNQLRGQNRTYAADLATQIQALADCNARATQKDRIYALQKAQGTATLLMRGANTNVPVYYNASRRELAFNLSYLPARNDGKYYQLWTLTSGKAKSMGMVHQKNVDGWVTVESVTDTKGFAISLESGPDEKSEPTLPPVMSVMSQ